MSTSIACQPAYKPTRSFRTRANPDRTIFGTTLDNYNKCWTLLRDNQAVTEAQRLHDARLSRRWTRPTSHQRQVHAGGWGAVDYHQPQLSEEVSRGYPRPSSSASCSRHVTQRKHSRVKSAPVGGSAQGVVACSRPLSSVSSVAVRKTPPSSAEAPQRPMSDPKLAGEAAGRPKLRIPADTRNYMKISSMKITETGAKDLINAKPVNKIGLGDTLQYNHQAFWRKEAPPMYRDNGHVLLLGQRFSGTTSNDEVTAPGGFYRLDTADRDINERFRWVNGRDKEVTMTHRWATPSRDIQATLGPRGCYYPPGGTIPEEAIPKNIRHKFGGGNVKKLLNDNVDEVCRVLRKEATGSG